jgi:hypothetical protein
MNWMEMLQKIFEVCIIPLLGILTTYLVMFIRQKSKELQETTDNEIYKKYIELLQDTIVRCVIATNQTYVEALKNKNAFDKDAQEKAFRMTYDAVMAILTDDAKVYLSNVLGDLEVYITKLIEAEVNVNKIIPSVAE